MLQNVARVINTIISLALYEKYSNKTKIQEPNWLFEHNDLQTVKTTNINKTFQKEHEQFQ